MARLLFKRKNRKVGNNDGQKQKKKGFLSKSKKKMESKSDQEEAVVVDTCPLGSSDLQQLFVIQEMLHRLVLYRSGTTQLQLIMSGFEFPNVVEWAVSTKTPPRENEPQQDNDGTGSTSKKLLKSSGMDGEFEMELYQSEFGEWRIECSSWTRDVPGSWEKHEITMAHGTIIIDESFA